MEDKWLFVVNPASGNGRGQKSWDKKLAELKQAGLHPEVWISAQPGNIEELVHKAVQEGYRRIASYGGDGTLNALVNGVMTQTTCPTNALILAHLSCGTGNDWCKTFEVPQDASAWVKMIERDVRFSHDVGVADVQRNGAPHRQYFVNIVGMSYDSHVVQKIDEKRMKHGFIQGKMLYDMVVASELLSYKLPTLEYRYDGNVTQKPVFNMAISICRFNGGGMMPTPYADPADGKLDVTVFGAMPLWMTIRDLPKLSKGTFFSNPNISWFRTAELEVDGIGKPDLVEADGESIGQTPARFTVLPKALQFVINTVPKPKVPHN
jgi:YegS/Rv2252/BmrU family lipid kinase